MPLISVMDVFRELKVEPEPKLAWAVGGAVRRIWEERHGSLPEKQLRRKTSGGGSHCFAVYPDSMRAEIVGVIRSHETEAERQTSLF